jgi:hypothetical protein
MFSSFINNIIVGLEDDPTKRKRQEKWYTPCPDIFAMPF